MGCIIVTKSGKGNPNSNRVNDIGTAITDVVINSNLNGEMNDSQGDSKEIGSVGERHDISKQNDPSKMDKHQVANVSEGGIKNHKMNKSRQNMQVQNKEMKQNGQREVREVQKNQEAKPRKPGHEAQTVRECDKNANENKIQTTRFKQNTEDSTGKVNKFNKLNETSTASQVVTGNNPKGNNTNHMATIKENISETVDEKAKNSDKTGNNVGDVNENGYNSKNKKGQVKKDGVLGTDAVRNNKGNSITQTDPNEGETKPPKQNKTIENRVHAENNNNENNRLAKECNDGPGMRESKATHVTATLMINHYKKFDDASVTEKDVKRIDQHLHILRTMY